MNKVQFFYQFDHNTVIKGIARGPERSFGPRAVLLFSSFTKHLHILYLLHYSIKLGRPEKLFVWRTVHHIKKMKNSTINSNK